MMKAVTVLLITILFTAGCNMNSTDPASNVKVKGKLTLNGQPMQNVSVMFDDFDKWSTNTDGNGYFEVKAMTEGKHKLTAYKELDNSTLIKQEITVHLSGEVTDLGEIQLAEPPHLFDINQDDITETVVPIVWNATTLPGFKEYRLYRTHGESLSENTAELIYTTTSQLDTTFMDKSFRTGKPDRYRIYVETTSGAVSGSNIVEISLPEVNLVVNGSFESSSSSTIPDYWRFRKAGNPEFNYFTFDSSNPVDGSKCIKLTYIDAQSHPDSVWGAWGGIAQQIITSSWVVGKTYTLSFWVKAETGKFQVRLTKNNNFDEPLPFRNPILTYTTQAGSGWVRQDIDFQIDEGTSYLELWVSTGPGIAENGLVSGYIDNVKIIK